MKKTSLGKASLEGRAGAVRAQLHKWWAQNGRQFDWRLTRDPYLVLVAELMLHRTRASQVLPVYRDFTRHYPTLESASIATSAELTRVLSPLGLRWRNNLVISLIHEINDRVGGQVPSSMEELKKLPGVSDYIAGAVDCFVNDSPQVLLDTNIVRVVGRLAGVNATDSSRRSNTFRNFVRELMPRMSVREFYFAILDLSALVCRPVGPHCEQCPLVKLCRYAEV